MFADLPYRERWFHRTSQSSEDLPLKRIEADLHVDRLMDQIEDRSPGETLRAENLERVDPRVPRLETAGEPFAALLNGGCYERGRVLTVRIVRRGKGICEGRTGIRG